MLTPCWEHLKSSYWFWTGNLMYYVGMNVNVSNITLTDHHHLTETEHFHASGCLFYHHLVAQNPQNYYRKHRAIEVLCFIINIWVKTLYPPPKWIQYFIIMAIQDVHSYTVDRTIYFEHKLWCHMSSCCLCTRPAPAPPPGTQPSHLGSLLCTRAYFVGFNYFLQTHSKLCQAFAKEAREANPAL